MKILEIIPSLSSGGAERFVVDLSNQLANCGEDVSLYTVQASYVRCGYFYKNEIQSNVYYRDLGCGNVNLVGLYKVYIAIRKHQADIVHIHSNIMLLYCLFAILFYRKSKYVVTQHTKADVEKQDGGIKFFVKRSLLYLKLIYLVSIGKDNKKTITDVYGIDTKLIVNGRHTLKTTNEFSQISDEIYNLKKDNKTKVFIHVARCAEPKNQLRLVRCFNEVCKNEYNVILLIVGSGFTDTELGIKIKSIACNNIYFLGEKHNVADYLYNSDYFCLSSDYEGMPISLLEALSCGCIPVGTPVSGFNDIVVDGETGFVSQNFTDKSYVATLIRAINNLDQINIENLKKQFYDHYSINICAANYSDYFTYMMS